jgi:beta-N-acetylhexosaminidase
MIRRYVLIAACLVVLAAPTLAQTDPLAGMTLEQKVAQMFLVTLHGPVMTEDGEAFLRRWHPGGVVLFTDNVGTPQAMTQLTNDFQQTMAYEGAPPLFIAIDQEGNVVARLTDGFTVFPNPLLTTAAGPEMAYQVGQATGEELSAVGINLNLAPVVDLETNRDNPIIYHRSYGSHPQITSDVISQIILGTQSMNVLATAKHFPGHGETNEDSHGVLPEVNVSRERVEALEMQPFRAAISSGVGAIMVGHLWYPAFDPQRQPASLSHNIVTGLLREELGYNGLLMTDAMDMNAVDMDINFADSMVMAVQAGEDMMPLGPSFGTDVAERSIQAVIDAVHDGRISEERINDSVRRILSAKQQYGILDWQPLDPDTAPERVHVEEHAALVDRLFDDGVTVAFDHNNLIPLTPDRKIAIVFLGTRYQIQDECKAYNPDIRWVAIADTPDAEQIAWAVEAANWSDTTVVWTQNADKNPAQQALVNALPQDKTIAVAIWSVYDWLTYPNVSAYVATFSPARPAVPAACAILFGAQPALGQLPVSLSLNLQAGTRGS